MRIVIDMQGAQTESRFRGIGRYTLSFAHALVRNRSNHEVYLALSDLFPDTIESIRAAFDDILPQNNIRVWSVPGPVKEREAGNEWRRETAELIREAFLASLKPDVVHIPSLFEGYLDDAVTSIGRFDSAIPVSVTIHDLIPLLNSEYYLRPNPVYELYYRRKLEYLRRASLFLAISESSRSEALSCLEIDDSIIVNTGEAADSQFHSLKLDEKRVRSFLDKFGLRREFVLYTGGADERKNLPRLIQAYARLPKTLRNSHQLVLAGKMPDSEIAHLRSEARSVALADEELRFTGYLADTELVEIYNLCKVFVFPSWHEGFGLPALEAMSCNAAVIGANTSSLPEVIGLEDALFDPYSCESISDKLMQSLSNEAFRTSLQRHAESQSKKFSWDRSARLAIEAFEGFIAKREGSTLLDLNNDKICDFLLTKLGEVTAKAHKVSDVDLLACASSIARNLPQQDDGYQLLVDISELVQRDAKTGVQRVTRSILRELLVIPLEGYRVVPVYATTERPGYRYARAFISEFMGWPLEELEDDHVETQAGDIFLGLDLQAHVVAAQKESLEAMYRNGIKIYFIIHDLLPITMPQYFGPGTDEAHIQWLRTISRFDGVICVSRTVAEEVASWLSSDGWRRLRPFKIGWSHNGADMQSSVPTTGLPSNADEVLSSMRERPTFLMVGTIEPRKGHAQTLAAFELIWKEGAIANLVIVGKEGWNVEGWVGKLRCHPELGKKLYWLEGISDEYLERLYDASACLIAASEGEGFGLPLIEAAQHKLSIIARDIPVFREVAGEHAFYFKGADARALAAAIKEWLALYENNGAPRSEGMPWLTWAQSTRELLKQILPLESGAEERMGQGIDNISTERFLSSQGEHDGQVSVIETSL